MSDSSPASSGPQRNIALVGVGGIGSTFAHYLAKGGHNVTAVARPGSLRFSQLQRDEGVMLKTGERAQIQVADHLDEQAPFDLVIVTTLAHQAEALLPSLQRSQARSVHFMFNTFEPERFQAALGADRCSFGMPFVMGMLDADGRLKATVSASRKTLHGNQRWADLFTAAGIASAYEPHMQDWLRAHVPLCIAMESISYQAQQRGGGATWAQAMTVARGLHGGFRIVEALGHPLYPSTKKLINRAPNALLAGMLWSISRNKAFRELLATGVNECRTLAGVLLNAASGAQAVVPAAIAAVENMRPAN